MSDANVALVRTIYDAFARGDVAAVLEGMSPAIIWNEAENFPYADQNPYVGPTAVAQGVFARLGGEWDGFSVKIEEIHGAGNVVVARGRYTGIYRKTGRSIDAQMVHFWRVTDGKAISFQQYVDTLQVARAVGP